MSICISKSIEELDDFDIGDNLYYYHYNVKHLTSLLKKGIDQEDPRFLSSYRSFEGEVFENFIYEKLLRYAQECDEIDKFVLKGYHQNQIKSNANMLSISEKQQIVYRTKSREISEFDAMFITKHNELYFVEMTLVKSVLKLKKRLRKKKALLETIFPNYTIKALIILNEGATGTKQLPSYAKVWYTKHFSAKKVLEFIQSNPKRELRPKEIVTSCKMVEAESLKPSPFRYYNTMSWITRKLRASKRYLLDLKFLLSNKIQRYHDLYNKFYIGYLQLEDARALLELDDEYRDNQRVIVALEKKHTDEIVLTYYIQISRKKLYLYSFNEEGKVVKEKKDPYGITVTEVYHINRIMDKKYKLTLKDISKIRKLLRERFIQNKR
ncbi:hypothetical protein MNB_SM-7-280 [hydrothermal vent metagenome]|uniref:Uncharacterized protein n=1 Tax=hydrothermal vent metagenome TaxID=652676 RepID=A0A1W1BPP9_9ZZZZ